MAKSPKYKSIDDYILSQPKEAQIHLRELRAAILQASPQAKESFNYGVPAFVLVKDGKIEQQILMAAFKNHVGLYPHPSTIEHFSKELASYKKGKQSIQFPFYTPIPKSLVTEMISYRLAQIKEE